MNFGGEKQWGQRAVGEAKAIQLAKNGCLEDLIGVFISQASFQDRNAQLPRFIRSFSSVLKGAVSSCLSSEGSANPETSGTGSNSNLSNKFCVAER